MTLNIYGHKSDFASSSAVVKLNFWDYISAREPRLQMCEVSVESVQPCIQVFTVSAISSCHVCTIRLNSKYNLSSYFAFTSVKDSLCILYNLFWSFGVCYVFRQHRKGSIIKDIKDTFYPFSRDSLHRYK
jgi:hypothetical protein